MNENNFVFIEESPSVPPRTFSGAECVFAWLSLLLGYTFCRAFPASDNPLSAFVFVLLLYGATFIILAIKGLRFTITPILTAVSSILVASSLVIGNNEFLNFFAYTYSLAAYTYFVYTSTGNSVNKIFSNYMPIDFIKALFVLPFISFNKIFKALFLGKKSGKMALKVIAGLAIAIIPTIIVFSLLSYDSSFMKLWDTLFTFNSSLIFSYVISAIFSIPIGMYLFGLFISSSDKKGYEILTVKQCENTAEKLKKVPILTTLSATAPILLIYVLFFISQIEYYISGFTSTLPDELSYAEYAREGFFQLCVVAVINLLIIIFVSLVMRRSGNERPLALKLITIIYSVCTLFLISTAVAKMLMYIEIYGLTQKRIYAFWFMIVLTVVFILISINQFIPKIKTVALSLAVAAALFTVLSVANVDSVIAKSNVDRYINGDLAKIDTKALLDLGDNAVPELVRLYDHVKEKSKTEKISSEDFSVLSSLKYELQDLKSQTVNDDLSSFTISHYRAKNAIENWEK